VMEGRGSDGGGGNGGAGPSLSTVGARRLGVGGRRRPCARHSLVGGYCVRGRSLQRCSGALGCRLWAVGLVRVRCTFVGGGLLIVGGLFVGCRLWALARSGTDADRVLTFMIMKTRTTNDNIVVVRRWFPRRSRLRGTWNPHAFVASMWPALVHLVTWRCDVVLAVVVVGVGDGCGWRPLVTVTFSPSWAVTKGRWW
jgi:hypothetical protein